MNHDTKCSCSAYSLPKKNLHCDLIALANRKHKQRNRYDCFEVFIATLNYFLNLSRNNFTPSLSIFYLLQALYHRIVS